MQRVHTAPTQQGAVPPPAHVPPELSREERQQLRVIKHNAFQRHQQNATWVREILQYTSPLGSHNATRQPPIDTMPTGDIVPVADSLQEKKEDGHISTGAQADALRRQITQEMQKNTDLEANITSFQDAEAADRQRFEELMAQLQGANDSASLTVLQERIAKEKTRLSPSTSRELEIVKL